MKQKFLSYLSIAAVAAMFPLAAQANITAEWLTHLGHIGETDNWSTADLPNQAGDVGNATSTINISAWSTDWAGTINISGGSGAQLNLANNSTMGTWSDVNISGESWLRAAHTSSGRTTSFGFDGNTNITIGSGGARFYRSGTPTAGAGTFNVYGTINVNGGLLQTDAEGGGDIRIRNDLHLNNGNSLAVNAGTLQLITAGSTTSVSFANNGDTASRFYGTAANSRLLFYSDLNIDISGFDWNQTAERSWELFDWDSFGNAASGFLQADGIVQSGTDTWTIASGTSRYYNEAGGLVWTYTDGDGQEWTFTESTGTLTVIPEPATVALLTGLLALGLVFVRRRLR